MKRFAMITHFTGIHSRENFVYYPFYHFISRFLPSTWIKRFIPYLPPHKVLAVQNITSNTGRVTEGCAIMCPLLPEQFFRLDGEKILNKLLKCCKKAQFSKADIVGLAAFTSIVGNEGEFIAQNSNISVTSGNTYTAFLAIDSIFRAVNVLNLDLSKARLIVLGATGDIGSVCTKILSKTFQHLTLVARDSKKLKQLIAVLPKNKDIKIEQNLDKIIGEGDVVLCVTSSVVPLVDVKMLKAGSILCDVSIPPAVIKKPKNFRKDVLIYDGGKARLPNPKLIIGKKWHRLFPHNIIFGCLAETILLALEEKIENFSIGRGNISEARILEIAEIASKHGFETAPFVFGDYIYTKQDCDVIKGINQNKYFSQSDKI